MPSWWMPASWAKALRPTIALLRCTWMPVMCETSRLVGHEARRVDAGRAVVVVAARAHGHDDLFERAVAGPLADAVDRALDLAGAVLDGRRGCWRRPGPGRCGSGR